MFGNQLGGVMYHLFLEHDDYLELGGMESVFSRNQKPEHKYN
jgi:hypothetical protein